MHYSQNLFDKEAIQIRALLIFHMFCYLKYIFFCARDTLLFLEMLFYKVDLKNYGKFMMEIFAKIDKKF